jgi:hypothetical protein
MTSEPVRDPLADHLLTPQNCALVIIDYQPTQIRSIRSMDQDLLVDRVVHLARFAMLFRLPVVLSTVNVSTGRNQPTHRTAAGRSVGMLNLLPERSMCYGSADRGYQNQEPNWRRSPWRLFERSFKTCSPRVPFTIRDSGPRVKSRLGRLPATTRPPGPPAASESAACQPA